MEVRYRRERNESYLILEEEGSRDSYAVRMLTENEIPGVLKLSVKQMDGRTAYCYEIGGKQSLKRLLEKQQITAEEFRRLFYGLERSLQSLEEYLLDVETVLLEPEFLYLRPDFSQVFVCSYPGRQGDFFAGLQQLSQYLLNKIDHLCKDSVEMAYEVFRITCEEDFSFRDILRALETESREVVAEEASEPEAEPALPEEWPPERWEEEGGEALPPLLREPEKKPFWSVLIPVGGFLLVGIFYVLGGLDRFSGLAQVGILLLAAVLLVLAGLRIHRGEQALPTKRQRESRFPGMAAGEQTAVLAPSSRPLPRPRRLISQNLLRAETISVDHLPFVLGKQPDVCDGVIPQSVISRRHARLEQREEGVCLIDLGSTNGTFQNGKRLIPHRPYRLQCGDEVTLADLKYIFE